MSTLDRFELPDLLVTLCEAGQTSLAARIARSLLGSSTSARSSAARQTRDLRERAAQEGGVSSDEAQPARAIEPLQDDLEAARNRR